RLVRSRLSLTLYSTLFSALCSPLSSFFFFCCSGAPRALPSFPTRRSSDLVGGHLARPGGALVEVDRHLRDRGAQVPGAAGHVDLDRKSTRLNSSHVSISYAVFCLKKKKNKTTKHSQTHKELARVNSGSHAP